METTFMGYRRADGTVGIRNKLLILPSVFCANTTAEKIAARVPGAVLMRHAVGCAQVGMDLDMTVKTLTAMGTHPNAGAVLVVGLGCERVKPHVLCEAIRASGRPAEVVVIQEAGGTTATIEEGVRLAKPLAELVASTPRETCDLSSLILATKCGGTDATSGLAANPAVGYLADWVVGKGGSAILSELSELVGTEDILAGRAVSPEVAKKVYDAIYEIEDVLRSGLSSDLGTACNQLISPGNFAGGVSSIVEKALGGVYKSGTSPIVDVLRYATRPEPDKHGLFLMAYESHDGEVVTGMVGAGAQIVAFTSGRGNPTGHPLVPVIKVTGNHTVFEHMRENFDIDASPIIADGAPIREVGENLVKDFLRVINGEPTASERWGGDELFCVGRRHGYKRKPRVVPDCEK